LASSFTSSFSRLFANRDSIIFPHRYLLNPARVKTEEWISLMLFDW